MSFLVDICQWWNLIYAVPFAIGAVLVVLSVLGTSRYGAHAGYHGSHAPTHGHLHASHSASSTHSAHGARGAHGEHSAQRGRVNWHLLQMLHLDNIPPLMLLQNFLLFWGVAGWGANHLLAHGSADPARFIMPSLLLTSCGALVLTLSLSVTLARFAPADESFAVSKRALEGCIGEAVSSITANSGSVYLRDSSGTLHHIAARTTSGAPPLDRGNAVLVIEYSDDLDYYLVKPWTPEAL